MRKLILLLSILVCIVGISSAQDEDRPDADTCWEVSVWYPSSEHPGGAEVITRNADMIYTINPFWYTPKADGTLIAVDGSEDVERLTEWRDAGLLIVPSIFSNISGMIEDEAVRAFHIEEIVSLIERMDYDGIDIDYEGFAVNTREPFSLFIEALSAALHDKGYLLSIAVHAKAKDTGNWQGADAQDWSRIAPAVDIFGIMTYDYTSRNEPPGPVAPLSWVLDVLDYASSVTDMAKVRMGVPFYGYTWQRGTPPATTINYEGVQRWIQSFQPKLERDGDGGELYTNLKVTGLPRQIIYITDSVALETKISAVLEAHPELGGIAIWGIGGEDPANWDVLHQYLTPCEKSE